MSRIDIKEFFTKYLEDLKSKVNRSYSSNYSSTYNNSYSNGFYAYFYEWSDMNKAGKKFNSREELFNFFNDCKISYDEEDKKYINSKNLIYGICVKETGKLLLADKYMEIRDKFKAASIGEVK